MNTLLNGAIKKILSITPSNIYAVGGNGTIVHYNGNSWQRIESGTDLPIQDIWGAYNEATGEYEILAVASKIMEDLGERQILKITGNQTVTLDQAGMYGYMSGVWFVPNTKYYIVGSGVFRKRSLNGSSPWVRYEPGEVTQYFSFDIKGNALNDIFVVGSFAEIVHFNGINWKTYHNIPTYIDNFYSLDFKKNLMLAVGSSRYGRNAVLVVGRRK
ncbi:MAG: hypothetical protein GF313_14200 [Caldithrix sp.]|nr:hypothetical protein [Caldithrix sp.]